MTSLASVTISSPGFYGLNKQQFGVMDIGWATEATNCVFDSNGRITSRKGWRGVGDELDSPVVQIAEYIDDAGTSSIVFVSNKKIYTNPISPIDITGTIQMTGENWKFQNFNGKIVGFQQGHTPIVWDRTKETFEELPSNAPTGNEVLAAYGRLWALDESGTVLHYSDLLIEDTWHNSEQPGSSGVIDLKTVWVYGRDTGVAIATFNGHLVIFGKNSILIYAGPEDPMTMSLVEVIHGIGCVARDSVATVGEDLMFLSSSGVRSLGRVIQQKSLPLGDETRNVRDYLMTLVNLEDVNQIRSCYSEYEGFYLLSLPNLNTTLCVDMKTRLEDGSRRITEWNSINPRALCVTQDQEIYLGSENRIGIYSTYLDNGKSYRMVYISGWLNLSEEGKLVIPKYIEETVIAEANVEYVFKWGFDYQDRTYSYTKRFITSDVAEYGVDEYGGEAEYSGGAASFFAMIPAFGSGKVMKIGGETEVKGAKVSIQQIIIKAKIGRI